MNRLENASSFCDWLNAGKQFLQEQGIADFETDAWYLMEYVWQLRRSDYFLKMQEPVQQEKAAQYRALLEKRAQHIPLQQLTQEAWFYGRKFFVNENVLIPRQDTEILVEEALKKMPPKGKLLDICTGSGCILLTLLLEKQGWSGVGLDISEPALAVAGENQKRLGTEAVFFQSDLCEALKDEAQYDGIVSNPPYICSSVIPTLMEEVREHEPLLALDGKEDGLFFYRKITAQAKRHLKPGGFLLYEIGYDQGAALLEIFAENGFHSAEIVKDLAGLDRVACAKWQE